MTAQRWGHFVARHRWAVIAVWVVVLVASAGGTSYLQGHLGPPNYSVPGSQSAQVTALLQKHFSGQGAEQDVVVFQAVTGTVDDPANRAAIAKVLAVAQRTHGVVAVIGPFSPGAQGQVSRDHRAALALVGLNGDSSQIARRAASLQTAIADAAPAQLHAWLTGYSPISNNLTTVENSDTQHAEYIGIPVALVVLLIALGAAVAAALPLLLALCGVLLALGALALVSFGFSFDSLLAVVVIMIGTGIGIDYSLFVVSRFREELARQGITRVGPGPGDVHPKKEAIAESVGVALATSGKTVLFSGVILAISMCSLLIINSPIYQEISIAVVAVVASTLVAAWTLLPTVLAALGPRVNNARMPRWLQPAEVRGEARADGGGWARWAHTVMRFALPAGAAVAAILVVAAIPLGSLRYGIDLGTSSLLGQPSAKAEQVLVQSFGPGVVGPVQVVVTGKGDTPLGPVGLQRAHILATALSHDRRVGLVEAVPSTGRVLIDAVPTVAVDSTAATALVIHIRNVLAPAASAHADVAVLVGGTTAQLLDVSQATSGRVPYVLVVVLALAALFLLVIFRSIALPLTAVVMNLLSSAAAIGIMVAVFQWGHLAGALGFTSVGYLQVYMPITVFVMLFGLSMDYEVFLVRRMQETWIATRDNDTAIATGIEHTARPIAASAAIMVAVFGSFLSANVLELKEFGLGLAVAIALDATLVRLVLIPALMHQLGRWNWWLPSAFSRWVPGGADPEHHHDDMPRGRAAP